ncbi:MAG: MBL fold metallo-hydrolase [Acidobacteriota bacterium]
MKNGYVVACTGESEAVYIDPGDEVGQVISFIEKNDLQLQAVIATHAHMDHICGIGTVKKRWDVPVYLHREDEFIYSEMEVQSRYFGMNYSPPPPGDFDMEEGQVLSFGGLELKVYHTPGHSPGGVCLEAGDNLFTGDLIFAGSVGRTDLPGGDYDVLMNSIQRIIVPLPESQSLWPGHGPRTTVGQELKGNPFRNSFLP